MKVAILGSTSQIAKDLIESLSNNTNYECSLYSRDSKRVIEWLECAEIKRKYVAFDYSEFNINREHDVIINFVGVGDPAIAKVIGSDIFDITYEYDMMALDYLKQKSETKYIFLSSGAVYGGDFKKPVTHETCSIVPLNNLCSTDWYAVSKLYAEARHRALADLAIIDVRVFNYFSHTQNINARFFITDVIRAISNGEVFLTSADNIVRDFITPPDFFNLIDAIINSDPVNIAVDCYTKAPVEKFTLLSELKRVYGLQFKIEQLTDVVNATGIKNNYYSTNKVYNGIRYTPERSSLEGVVKEMNLMGIK